MERALWITRKNYLCRLIKKVSDAHGGDEIDYVRQVCKEVLIMFPDEKIELAIRCHEEMIN